MAGGKHVYHICQIVCKRQMKGFLPWVAFFPLCLASTLRMQIPKSAMFVSYFERKSGSRDERFIALQAKYWLSSLRLNFAATNCIYGAHFNSHLQAGQREPISFIISSAQRIRVRYRARRRRNPPPSIVLSQFPRRKD